MKIFIDDSYICHKTNETGEMRRFNVPFFSGKCDEFIEGFRYIPEGETWIREDGMECEGETAFPISDYAALDAAQRLNEQAALRCLGFLGEEAPLEEAKLMRAAIDTMTAGLDDGAEPGSRPHWWLDQAQ